MFLARRKTTKEHQPTKTKTDRSPEHNNPDCPAEIAAAISRAARRVFSKHKSASRTPCMSSLTLRHKLRPSRSVTSFPGGGELSPMPRRSFGIGCSWASVGTCLRHLPPSPLHSQYLYFIRRYSKEIYTQQRETTAA